MRNKKKKFLALACCLTVLLFVLATGKLNAQAPSISLETIQKRYKGKWPKSITYIKQKIQLLCGFDLIRKYQLINLNLFRHSAL